MSKNNNIFLIGPMGTGKSTIGKVLAEMLNQPFYDSDAEIETRTGATISWIFDVEGEDGFRKREEDTIDDLTSKENIVLATGGGVIKNSNNRHNLINRGWVVYLSTSPETTFERIGRDKRRPLLDNPDPLGTLRRLLAEREKFYLETADIVVKTDDLSAHAIAHSIISQINDLKR